MSVGHADAPVAGSEDPASVARDGAGIEEAADRSRWDIHTKCIHAGPEPDPFYGSVAPPIYQTSTFAFATPEEGAARFAGEDGGYIYTRMGNPTTAMLESAVAELEEGTAGLGTASGMAAVSTTFFALLSAGDHVVCTASVYGPTRVVLEREFARFGIDSTMVDTSDPDRLRSAVTTRTRVVFVETPANPTLAVTDIAEAAEIAMRRARFWWWTTRS